MNVKRLLIGLGVIVVLGVGGFFAYRQFFAPEPAVEEPTAVNVDTVDTVSVDTGVGIVSAEGQIVPLRDAMLTFQGAGQVAEILVSAGDTVEAGAPLVRLDATDQEIALQQAQAGLAQAQANLGTAQAGVNQAQTAVTAAQVGVSAAEANLAQVKAEASPEQIAVSQASVAIAAANVSQASGNQSVTMEGATDAQIQAAQAQLRAAQAAQKPLQDALGQIGDEESDARDILQLQYNASVAQVQAAQAALNELQAGATDAERQAAFSAVSAAVAQRDAAEAQLNLLLAGAKPEQITVAEAGVEQAQAAVAEAELGLKQAETAVTQAEAGVEQAQAAVDVAQEALDQMTLTAPFAGTVGSVMVELGELAAPGLPVVALADFSGWQIKTTNLNELDVVAVENGLPVEITVDALPGETLKGTVAEIADVSALVQGDVTYVVTIDLEPRPDLPLRWGMTVFVNIDVS
ncbi:MAG: efflux RND transporter periplasmic adaptor subunit [Ardenticatenaceae bacterium]|nr:efflux RND transporter periplasmic adaptor subunit [Ardenticatenaceae bacterium]